MSENHPTRRDVLMSLTALPLLASTLEAQAGASSVCFMSAVEMAGLIRAKKLSAREALAAHLTQIEQVNPKVNAIVTLVPELAAAAAARADEMQARGEMSGPLPGIRRPQCRLASRRKDFQLACRSSAAPRRTSVSCSSLTHSNRRLASASDIRRLPRRPLGSSIGFCLVASRPSRCVLTVPM